MYYQIERYCYLIAHKVLKLFLKEHSYLNYISSIIFFLNLFGVLVASNFIFPVRRLFTEMTTFAARTPDNLNFNVFDYLMKTR